MARVELTRHLLKFFPQLEPQPLQVEGQTVAEIVAALERSAPGFAFYICDELGRLRAHVNIFVEEERLADRRHLSDPVGPTTRVLIMQALSGG